MFCAEGMDHTQPDWFRLVSLFSPVLSPCSPFSLSFSLSVCLSLSLSRARLLQATARSMQTLSDCLSVIRCCRSGPRSLQSPSLVGRSHLTSSSAKARPSTCHQTGAAEIV
jgi:hypothetical protein